MSQVEIYIILKELGGTATNYDIVQKAKEKFPELSLWKYVGHCLTQLSKSGYVKHYQNKKMLTWTIADDSLLKRRNIKC